MKTLLVKTVAILLGCIVGMITMMLTHLLFFQLIPLPDGTTFGTPAQIAESVSKFELKHYLNPFIAHCMGTFIAAVTGGLIAFSYRRHTIAIIGLLFLIAGILNSFDIPAPLWYDALDLIFCYMPMAWLGLKVVEKIRKPLPA